MKLHPAPLIFCTISYLAALTSSAAVISQLGFNDGAGTNVASSLDTFGFLGTTGDANLFTTDGAGSATFSNAASGSFKGRNFSTTYSSGTVTLTFSINAFSFTHTTTKGAKAGFGLRDSSNNVISEIRIAHGTNGNARFQGVNTGAGTTTIATNLGLGSTGINYLGRAVVDLDADTYLMEFSLDGGSAWTTITSGAHTGDLASLRVASAGPSSATTDPFSISFDYAEIDYIPEPSGPVLLGLGLLTLFRRRR